MPRSATESSRHWERETWIFPRLYLLQNGHYDDWAVVEADVLAGGAGADAPLANRGKRLPSQAWDLSGKRQTSNPFR